jgi:hypothetical protein
MILFFIKHIILEQPHEDHIYFCLCHLINPLADLSEFPEFITTSHEFVKVFKLHLLLGPANLLQNIHKLRLLQFVGLIVENLFDMFVLIQQIVVAELTASDLIVN